MTWEVIQLDGRWYVHGPDDENHVGPFDTRQEAEEYWEEVMACDVDY